MMSLHKVHSPRINIRQTQICYEFDKNGVKSENMLRCIDNELLLTLDFFIIRSFRCRHVYHIQLYLQLL